MKTKLININLFALILILAFASCKKDKTFTEQEYSIVETHEVTAISDTGIVASASFIQKGTEEIIDCGFVWSRNENPTIESSKVSIGAVNENENFIANINNDLYKDKDYHLRAYVQTENYVSYGNDILFSSKGGLPPEIFSFYPTEGGDSTEVIISGKNFSNNKNNITLLFGTDTIRVDSSTNEKIFFTTPNSPYTGNFSIFIELNGKRADAAEQFKVLGPLIYNITPNPAKAAQEITIEGVYFGSEISDIQLTINSKDIEVLSYTNNRIIAYIPYNIDIGENILTLKINNKIVSTDLTILSSWKRRNDIGNIEREGAVGFSIGNKGYIGTGFGEECLNDFWEYNPDADTWTQKADFGGTERSDAVGFSVGNKGYIGTGWAGSSDYKKDFWEYNPITNQWSQKSDFGGSYRGRAVGFFIGNKGYVGTGNDENNQDKNDLWEYNPDADTWTQKADFGGTTRGSAVGFSIENKGYIGTGFDDWGTNDFWEYNPETDNWTQKADFAGYKRGSAVGFSIENKGYIGTGYTHGYANRSEENDLWEYCPEIDKWFPKEKLPSTKRNAAVGFSIGNKGYIGTGRNYGVREKDFWEYDPN